MMSDQSPYTVPLSVGPSTAGGPIYFTDGPFAGKTVRTSVAELQKADAGRKFANKDRRPLDPPPVAQVRFFEVLGAGTLRQYEQEILGYDDKMALGLVCQVDLFPVVLEAGADGTTRDRPMTDLLAAHPLANLSLSGAHASGALRFSPWLQPSSVATTLVPVQGSPDSATSTQPMNNSDIVQPMNNSDIVAYYGHYPIRESSNSTSILAGTRVATPLIITYNHREVLAFTFCDLAVHQEGLFSLRYRVSHIFSQTTDDGGLSHRIPVLASCFGGAFKIWSTKTFPGLSGSTALTQRLSLHGAPVNIRSPDHRNGSRKRQKRVRSDPSAEDTTSPHSPPGSSPSASASSPEARVSLSPSRTPNLDWGQAQAGYQWQSRTEPGPSGSNNQV